MSITKNLNVPFRAAEAQLWDGSASAQMILEGIGGGATQSVLDGIIQSQNAEPTLWHSDPRGMSGCLNVEKPASFANYFVVFDLPSALSGSEKIAYTIHHYQVATASLIFFGGVWVVIKGVQTDVDPLAGQPYSIEGFWLHNPWSPSGTAGGEFVAYNPAWLSTYFTPVSVIDLSTNQTSVWNGKYVSVCDPEMPKLSQQIVRPPKSVSRGDTILERSAAARLAQTLLESHNLSGAEPLVATLEGARPDTPELVQSVVQQNGFEYLVPFRRDDNVTAVVRMDARLGVFLGVLTISKDVGWLPITWDDVRHQLQEGSFHITELTATGGFLCRCVTNDYRFFKGAYCLYPSLVWAPCWESRSPYYPFYLISMGGQQFYVSSLDGTVYRHLHFFGPTGRQRPGGI